MLKACLAVIAIVLTCCLFSACSSERAFEKASIDSNAISAELMFDEDTEVERFFISSINDAGSFSQSLDSNAHMAPVAGSPAESAIMTLGTTPNDRKLIKNASLSIEVDDAATAAQTIGQQATAMGGYMSDTSRQQIGDKRFMIQMTVRIPSDKFDQASEDFQALGTVLSFNANAQDVTEEYVDTESRARNLKKTEERLLDHLSRSAKLEDILKAEQEITRVRGQIELLDGRLRYLANRVGYSSITITLQDKPGAEQVTPKKAYSAMHIASQASRSLIVFSRNLLSVAIWITIWSPIWLPITLGAVYLRKRIIKNDKKEA